MQYSIADLIDKYVKTLDSLQIRKTDVVEVIILAFLLYQVLVWIKRTRAWALLKGFSVLLIFIFLAWAFQLNTILWLAQNVFSLGITALIIVFQPELRRALEQLGQQNILSSLFSLDSTKEESARFSDKTVNELIKAVYEMAKVKTGALIVIEKNTPMQEYERTGITLDSVLSSQLLINIFEHNTPLHDGAIIVRGDRVVSVTCYLPLSDNMFLSKELGTRHRAAVGVSEVSDSLTIVVSEETGKVSVALDGKLMRNLSEEELREQLVAAQNKSQETGRFKLWKGRVKKREKLLTNNLGLKLLSVVAAVMLWLVIVSINDPVIYQDFSGVRVTMLNEDAVTDKDKVYRIEDNSDIISIRVRANRSIIEKLSAEDFTATADMEKNIKFDNLVGIEVTCSNRNVRNTDITKSRENVVIRIEDASSEQFNVVVNQIGQEGNGYLVGTAVPEQSLIQISGPASVIAEIRRVVVDLNKTGFTTDQVKNCEIKIYDNADNPIDTTYLEYNGKTTGMNVHVTMFKKKTVRLRVDYTGTPEQGYSFKELTFKPETIEIAGTAEDIADLREIAIPGEAVNIDGITEDTQINVDVTKYLPENFRLADEKDASVAVQVTLEKKQGKTIQIPVSEIEILNMPQGMNVDFGDLDEVELVIMGTSAQLAELDEKDVQVSLDLEDYSKIGGYKKALDVELPEDYSLMEKVETEFRLVRRAAMGNSNNNNR